jgi:hypothetical protein
MLSRRNFFGDGDKQPPQGQSGRRAEMVHDSHDMEEPVRGMTTSRTSANAAVLTPTNVDAKAGMTRG